jgi:hypothetical protein
MAISKRLRFEILRRDNHTCRYCGRTAPEVALTVDHVVPTALGGSDEPSNLVAACGECNGGKSSVPAGAPLVDDVAADAVRWARAMRQAAEERAQESAERNELMSWFNMVWCEWFNWRDEPFDTPDGAFLSIPGFIDAGLTKADLRELVTVTMNGRAADKWRYFCGCCWKRIRQLQDRAAEIVAESPNPQPGFGRTIYTRWTDDELRSFAESERHECEIHDDGRCASDVLCRIFGAARHMEMELIYSMRDWGQSRRDDAVCAEAEALLDA